MKQWIARWFPITRDWEVEKWMGLPIAILVLVSGFGGLARAVFDALGWFPY